MKSNRISKLILIFLTFSFRLFASSFNNVSNDTVAIGTSYKLSAGINNVNFKYNWECKKQGSNKSPDINDSKIYGSNTSNNFDIKCVLPSMNGCEYICTVRQPNQVDTKHRNETIPGDVIATYTVKITVVAKLNVEHPSDFFNSGIHSYSLKYIENKCIRYEWQIDENNGMGFNSNSSVKDIDNQLNIANKSGSQNHFLATFNCKCNKFKIRCKLYDNVDGSNFIYSDVDTVNVNGCLYPAPDNRLNLGSSVKLISTAHGKSPTYQWQVMYPSKRNLQENNNENAHKNDYKLFENITADDSDIYSGYNSDTLKIKIVTAKINGATFRCIQTVDGISINDNSKLKPEEVTLTVTGKIAKSPFQLMAAYYSGISGLKDDNSANLTQLYLRASIPFNKGSGIDVNSCKNERLIWARNYFVQVTYTTNNTVLNALNKMDTTFSAQNDANFRLVNRLDLLQYATFNFNATFPLLTKVVRNYRPHCGDFMHIYFEPFSSLLETNVSTAKLKDTSSQIHVYSLMYGLSISSRTENLKLNNMPLYFETSLKMFWINPLSNSVNASLNYQTNRVINDIKGTNSRPITTNRNYPYFNLDELIMYATSSTSNSNVFLHLSFYSNFVGADSKREYNNFYMIQAGYAADIVNIWSKLFPKSKS